MGKRPPQPIRTAPIEGGYGFGALTLLWDGVTGAVITTLVELQERRISSRHFVFISGIRAIRGLAQADSTTNYTDYTNEHESANSDLGSGLGEVTWAEFHISVPVGLF
jgi:hypothetical protein